MSIPPGLPPNTMTALPSISGRHPDYKDDWMDIPRTKLYTNVFVWDEIERKILLGYKKRGFGMGLYNGFGGKVESGETVSEAALRELKEESGISANIVHCGTLLFFAKGESCAHLVEVFRATSFAGDPTESEEMRPDWYALSLPDSDENSRTRKQDPFEEAAAIMSNDLPSIPFDHMWPDVPLWFPLMLSEKRFIGRVDFAKFKDDATGTLKDAMVKWWIGTITATSDS
ncbi:hypothetical protein Clacol_004978 [Clathrus columnatus]|uniref:Oxidized purine nucleoside triphosphate hydrolase n=1 Tax=Clathrus columnatus TaxID=1419009 RepID=A0AAV5AFN1_9AGAM|nr:hypothetical protein Clacol_004978 [Clathrus columnatus]